jgi:drug/metabolite transporter (DMT)-like permease
LGVGAVLSGHAFEITRAAGESIDGVGAAYQRIWGGVLIAGVWLAVVVARGRTGWLRPAAGQEREAARAVRSRVPVWGWVAITAMTGPVLGVSCYQWALSTAPSAVVLAVVATTPLAVMPVSYLLDGEKPGLRAVLGGVVAVAGVVALALL